MNRVFKFRAFDKSKGIMSKPFSFNQVLNFNDKQIRSLDSDNDIIMQFTGLKDKNSKEIYEGDVCNSNYFKNSEVVFWQNGWHFKVENLYHHSFNTSVHSFEVIGNIHESTKLVNG